MTANLPRAYNTATLESVPLLAMESHVRPLQPSTVALETHGCKLNQAESELLGWGFAEAGFQVVGAGEPADVVVINTCTVTHVADRKARHALRSVRRRNPGAILVATGCYVERAASEVCAMGEADLVVGNREKASLVRQVLAMRGGTDDAGQREVGAGADRAPASRTRATVKVQEGCDQVCAYCVVPSVRGRERSVPPAEVLAQVNRLLALGHKEIVLTGSQPGTYGFDLAGVDLAALIGRILAETAVPRLRMSSLQPQEVSERLLDLWQDGRLCPHFHVPLQSGSATVLRRMRRRYTPETWRDAVRRIRRAVPAASITTDVIVGFPGETDADFEDTHSLCDALGVAGIHVFPYSARPGTSASRDLDHVGAAVKAARLRSLLRLAQSKAAEYRDGLLGSNRPVLWERGRHRAAAGVWTGLTDNYVRVVAHSGRPLTGCITQARLVSREGDVVVAEPLVV